MKRGNLVTSELLLRGLILIFLPKRLVERNGDNKHIEKQKNFKLGFKWDCFMQNIYNP